MKVGIIAGSGYLPVILAQEIKKSGKEIVCIAVTKDPEEKLKNLVDEFYLISVGRVKKIIKTLSISNASEIIIIGKVSKNLLFKPMHFDASAIRIISKLKNKSDLSLFKAIADEFESNGLNLIDQRVYLGCLLPPKGVLTKHEPSKSQWLDIEYGMSLAREIAKLGIGQTIIVKEQTILAVEAIEGTDETIRRAGKLCNGGFVVTKASIPDQDFRFDVPTIGPNTIDALIESKASVIAVEYEKSFLLEPDISIQKANEAKIAIVVV
ncbi:MAG: LpxI family protein [bacterium]